jgi:uncharacterized protein YdeI (YjbR/CyaY-like superfamily)
MGKKDPKVDAYIAKAPPFAKPILEHIRSLVHANVPDVAEEMKWSFPHFTYKGMFAGVSAFKAHCSFGFWKHAIVAERAKELPKKGLEAMGQFGRLTTVHDLPSDAVMKKLLKIAMAVNDDGVKAPARKVTPVKDRVLDIPAYFTKAVKANAKAKAVFDAFPYSSKKEYVVWVTEAKSEATRDKRLAQAVEWLAEGKRRNWKYENC